MGSLITPCDLFLGLVFFFPLVFTCCSGTHLCSHHEATALIHFKNSFPTGDPKTKSWKEGTDCCLWDGVTCDSVQGHVIALDLSCSGLNGTFPSNTTLSHLQYLEKLNLAFNHFDHSEMSFEFGQLTNLAYLNLSNSLFTGKIPPQISHLSNLVSLDLSDIFDVEQPLTFDRQSFEGLVHNLSKVRHLILDRIDMSSINPNVFTNLSSPLRSLSLDYCDLRGNFPQNVLDLSNLNFLDLRGNQNLSLDLLKFNRSSNLQHLDLSDSRRSLSGELFDSISNLQALKYLQLSNSDLQGSIPRSLGNLLQLTVLDLSSNQLSGKLPSSLGNFLQLTHLDLSSNHLSGKLPSSLTNLTRLEALDVSDNSVEGPLPDEESAFPNLHFLKLVGNLLNGTLPSWLYAISSLQFLDLSDNQFSGHINEFQTKSLEWILLPNNKLQGPIPSSIFQQPNLTHLSLSQNYNLSLTSDATATALPIFPYLYSLHLSSCNVNEFPQFLKGTKGLEELDLSNNRIEGKIPEWMQDVGKNSLSYLNLSHNSFTQIFEKFPWTLIEVIDLSSNLIHGNIPIPGETTGVFSISNNNLSGDISSLICNASHLQVLDLSHNNLSGIIPPCFGKLSTSLSSLSLKKNKLNGKIPPTFAKGCALSNLDINGNQLEGPLTPSILNCEALEVLDVGNNNINDSFPHWLGSLPYLQVLVLKSNQMHGLLHDGRPRSNQSFSKIQIFDLSCNYFTGPLPVRYIKYFKAIINPEKNVSVKPYMGVGMQNISFQNDNSRRGDGFHSFSIGMVMKGEYRELTKIFTMYTVIDLSKNKFEGEIPEVIGKLISLKGLNLSHNNLGGSIPSSIGNLTNLEWLDLSSNKLSGTIPQRLADLTSLAIFNVSENQLHGVIPQGKQFNTFRNDSYEGNKRLCGFPVSKDCGISKPPPLNFSEDGSESELAFGWKAVLMGYGCGIVLGLSMGYVVFETGKPKWIVNLVQDYLQKRRSREPKIAHRNINGRRRRI